MSPILAIDLGKYNSVFCWFTPNSGEVAFVTASTTPASLRAELTRHAVSRVVIEACSPADWVHDLCGELNLTCLVANTAGAAWAWKNVKRKTDRDDALKLARLSSLGELPTVTVPGKAVRQGKSLIALRKRLVGQRAAETGTPARAGRASRLVWPGEWERKSTGPGRGFAPGTAAAPLRGVCRRSSDPCWVQPPMEARLTPGTRACGAVGYREAVPHHRAVLLMLFIKSGGGECIFS